METPAEHTVIIQNGAFNSDEWLRFDTPQEIVVAHTADAVAGCLQRIEQYLAQGFYAAGYLAYEAAAAFDPAFCLHTASAGMPLLWFGIYREPRSQRDNELTHSGEFNVGSWRATTGGETFASALAQIRRHIHAGDSYQVNYTFALQADFEGDAFAWFNALLPSQRASFCAWLNLGRFKVCSLSPELFFAQHGDSVRSRPMKGTIARGIDGEHDAAARIKLQNSAKDRAENVMIVDMIRNDLGRIAESGSVQVDSLFDIEQYPTVYQMTSTVSARTTASPLDVLAALFPCASITGAPKIRTMQIINALEAGPRGLYTGAIGYIAPATLTSPRRAQFSVAIRTAVIDRDRHSVDYAVGAGIVWDSEAAQEYAECLTKAQVLSRPYPDFDLLESLRWDAHGGLWLLDAHLQRLQRAAQYFGYAFSSDATRELLQQQGAALRVASKLRLTVGRRGDLRLDCQPLQSLDGLRVALAATASDTRTPFCHHKTTHRQVYNDALRSQPDCDDVILYNPDGLLTESTVASLVMQIDGRLLTPLRAAGLLDGVLREQLLQQGLLAEASLTITDLERCQRLFLINSVRGWMELHGIAGQQHRWTIRELGVQTPELSVLQAGAWQT